MSGLWHESEGGFVSHDALVGRVVREYVASDQCWGRYGKVTSASGDGVWVLWAGADAAVLADPMATCLCSRDELTADLIAACRALDLGGIPMVANSNSDFLINAGPYNEWLAALERAEGLGLPSEPREPKG